jgi:hypothetical protein
MLCFCGGILFYFVSHQYVIIFKKTGSLQTCIVQNSDQSSKKTIFLWALTSQGWRQEKESVIWTQDESECLHTVIAHFLRWYHDEIADIKQARLVSVALTLSKELIISCDRVPFVKNSSLAYKLFFIESLLKTIHENCPSPHSLLFLVNNTLYHDPHIELNRPWRVTDYSHF